MILEGDCLDVLPRLEAASCDSLVTDPPAGIGFMGVAWDTFKDRSNGDPKSGDSWDAVGGNHHPESNADKARTLRAEGARFRSWLSSVLTECYRVLKPGAHALVWALPRTNHWTGTAIEEAGFEVRDVITHHFGTGFPKSLDVSKAIDKQAGAARRVVGYKPGVGGENINDVVREAPTIRKTEDDGARGLGAYGVGVKQTRVLVPITEPATADAKAWEGWGTALKPATEFWFLARKPVDGTVAANVLEHGTGALNIGACRIPFADATDETESKAKNQHADNNGGARRNRVYGEDARPRENYDAPGRWPANLVLSHSPTCRPIGRKAVPANGHYPKNTGNKSMWSGPGGGLDGREREERAIREETVEAFECAPDCPVAFLDSQSGVKRAGGHPTRRGASANRVAYGPYAGGVNEQVGVTDTFGTASRFFYVAKPTRRERDLGLRGEKLCVADAYAAHRGRRMSEPSRIDGKPPALGRNTHPTVKPIQLMRYLTRLVTPPGGVVLDPFAGSGTTGCAAVLEGFEFVGIERETAYARIARRRIKAAAALAS